MRQCQDEGNIEKKQYWYQKKKKTILVWAECWYDEGSVQVLHQHVWGGRSEQNADPVDAFEVGGGGLSQKDDMLTLWREGMGELKHKASIAVKYLKSSIK